VPSTTPTGIGTGHPGNHWWPYRPLRHDQGVTDQPRLLGRAVDDGNTIAYAYVRLGQLAEVERDEDRVIGLARAAQRCAGLSRQVRALALQQEARGHSIAGSETACLTRFDEAHALIEGIRPQWSDEYRVGFFFEEARLNAQRAALAEAIDSG
jgi:hypothetical protein